MKCLTLFLLFQFSVNNTSNPALASAEASMVRKELQEMRDRVIALLDKLGASDALGSHSLGLGDGIVGQGKDFILVC